MTREQIIALGRIGDAWGYLPVAAQALRIAPADDAIRFLLCASLARLGLRTLAGEQIQRLGPQVRELAEVRALGASLDGLPPDRVPESELIEQARVNLASLGKRGEALTGAFGTWRESLASVPVFRTSDGNHARRVGPEPHEWRSLTDHASQIEQFCARHLASIRSARAPITLEGLDPPMLLQRLYDATPIDAGYAPPITVLQADPMEALNGLSLADLSVIFADERVRLLIGPNASRRLEEQGRERLGEILVGPALTVVGTRTRCEPPIESVVARLGECQSRELARLREALRARSASRDGEFWARRWADGPRRVLIPTCRFSTYVQHASRDLAESLRARGCEAEILIEPNDTARLSLVAYLDAIERLDPDLIVLINYPRSTAAGGEIPRDIPYVTWIQDAMPHLYGRAVGEAMGERDFVVGPIDAALLNDYAYPPERCLAQPVVVSEQKFHDGPIAEPDRFDCEIACITHHSETPEAMHQRLKAESGAAGSASAALDDLHTRIRELVSRAHRINLRYEIRELVHAMWSSSREDSRRIIRGYAIPLADRIYRHEALEWAAQIARDKDWRFHLHGNGWDRHPTLGEFARGPLAHGEDLRAAYQRARVNLHICLTEILHQRVSECFLSGGLPVCRVMPDHLSSAWTRAQHAMARDRCPFEEVGVETMREGEAVVAPCRRLEIAGSPEAMRMTALCQALGVWHRSHVLMDESRLRPNAERLMPAWRDASRMLPVLAEHAFVDREGLERVIVRAVERSVWRDVVIKTSARAIREHLTLDAMIDKTFAMIRESLGASSHGAPAKGAREPEARAA